MICWKCHEPVGGPVCVGCGAVQPLRADRDLFAVLGLPRRFHLDLDAVDAAWRELSRRVHPDRFAGRPAVERRMALQWTARINEARRVLRDPAARALYLATGRERPGESNQGAVDPEFLEEIFELQAAAPADPEGVRARVEALRAAAWEELDGIFARWEAGEAPLDAEAVASLLARLRYTDHALALVAHP